MICDYFKITVQESSWHLVICLLFIALPVCLLNCGLSTFDLWNSLLLDGTLSFCLQHKLTICHLRNDFFFKRNVLISSGPDTAHLWKTCCSLCSQSGCRRMQNATEHLRAECGWALAKTPMLARSCAASCSFALRLGRSPWPCCHENKGGKHQRRDHPRQI